MAGVKPLLETIGALLPKGIKAWHASPHDFDKVDLSKIGSGQGAQSYGPGFYAAESPKVSGLGGEYWKEFQRDISGPSRTASEFLADAKFDRQKAIEAVIAKDAAGKYVPDKNRVLDLLADPKAQVGPRVYELNLKADPRSFLQWDEPLKGQSNVVKAVPQLLDAVQQQRPRINQLGRDPTEATGEEAWRALYNPDRTMNQLRDAGIPGIRYLDQHTRQLPVQILEANSAAYKMPAGSRGRETWLEEAQRLDALPRTYNYVVNNPDIIEIMRKLAIPGMLTGGAASVYQPQGQQ